MMRPATSTMAGLKVKCGIYRVGEALVVPTLADPGDTLILLVEVTSANPLANSHVDLTIELWRGDRLRDRQHGTLELTTGHRSWLAFQLARRDGTDGSSRLIGKVLIQGREVARAEVLLGRQSVDAQGRFREPVERSATPGTILAYEEVFRRQLQTPS